MSYEEEDTFPMLSPSHSHHFSLLIHSHHFSLLIHFRHLSLLIRVTCCLSSCGGGGCVGVCGV